MRTEEEIDKEIRAAVDLGDMATVERLASELTAFNTPTSKARVTLCNAVICEHRSEYQDSLRYLDEALALYRQLEDSAGIAQVTNNKGNIYRTTGSYAQALECFEQAMRMYEKLDDRVGTARATLGYGALLHDVGEFPEALESFRHALALYQELGDQRCEALALYNVCNVYGSTGDYPQALEYCRRALALFEELDDRNGIADATSRLGLVYQSVGDYDLSIEHYTKALVLQEEMGSLDSLANTLGNLGVAYTHMDQDEKALELFQRSLDIARSIGRRSTVAWATSSIAELYLELDRDVDAERTLEEFTMLDVGGPSVRAHIQVIRGKIAERKGDLKGAKECLQQALEITTASGLRSTTVKLHEELRELAEQLDDFADYVMHNKKFLAMSEEIRGQDATRKLAMAEAERRVEADLRSRDKERALLYGALPEQVVVRMLAGEDVSGDYHEHASILFLDVVGFTTISDRTPPRQVVDLLRSIFLVCDNACTKHGLTKIKTIGDSYMAIAGVPEPLTDHAQRSAHAALDMLRGLHEQDLGEGKLRVRIGLHCGPVVAGIVGDQRLQYDVWGDTVNVASRMESTGEPGRIQVSEAFATALKGLGGTGGDWEGPEGTGRDRKGPEGTGGEWKLGRWNLELRGATEVKGKGAMTTYWLEGAHES